MSKTAHAVSAPAWKRLRGRSMVSISGMWVLSVCAQRSPVRIFKSPIPPGKFLGTNT